MPNADSFYGPFGDPSTIIVPPADQNNPTVLQASIGTDGDKLTIAFSKPVTGVEAASFVLSGNHILSGVAGSGATRTMTIDPPVIGTETPLLSYVGAGTIAGTFPLLAFSGKAVTNTSTVASLGTPAWSGIYERIRSRVQDTATGVSNAYFDKDIELELSKRLGPYGLTYSDVPTDDLLFVNTAVGFTVAVKTSVPLQTGGLNAPVVYRNITTDNSRITMQTAQISAGSNIDERTIWSRDAEAAWAQVSFVYEGRKKTPALSLFGLAGPRRGADRRRGGYGMRGF
ncbi:MAG: hypothetical protein V4671_30410 [Armatimonadota bacterium]